MSTGPGGTALVTGASSGLGLGLTEALPARGWRVLGLSRRPPPLQASGLRRCACDLTDASGLGQALASLNMLARLYAQDLPETHVAALAPGVVDTPLMEALCTDPAAASFPAVARGCAQRGTAAMPGPGEAAERVLRVLDALRGRPSGSSLDLRELLDPEAYRRLYGEEPA